MEIRPYAECDSTAIAELYNAHPENPNPVCGGITGEQFHRELHERGTSAFLVAEHDGDIVGTFGLFPTTGRICAGDGELFADMFFVTPAFRKGTLTGQLITAAITWMVSNGLEVLRLTVNPANRSAFRLYRRMGCISRGQLRPGADGNIELYCYVPLILKRVRDDIGDDNRRAVAGLASFGCVLQPLADELDSDTVTRDGRTVVDYRLDLGPITIEATVDVDAAEVLTASVENAHGRRELRLPEHDDVTPGDGAVLASMSWGRRTIEIEPDGTLVITADDHWGPLVFLTWPDAHTHRAAGWRGGPPRALEVTTSGPGLYVRDNGSDVACTILAEGDTLVSEYAGAPGQTLRQFQMTGLRQAVLDADPAGAPPIRHAPVGPELGVRDASQMPAAALALRRGAPVRWTEDATVVEVAGDGDAFLVTSSLVDRRVTLDACGRARVVTRVSHCGKPRPRRISSDSWAAAPDHPRVRFDERAGGIVRWQDGDGRVVHAPFPRAQRLACNPEWSAGLWVTRETDRHDRGIGMGWGIPHHDWVLAGDFGLRSETQDLTWTLDADRLHTKWNVDISTSDPRCELVLWLTPATAPGSQVRLSSLGEVIGLDAGGGWQRWTMRVGVELIDGRWLCIEPDLGQEGFPEIIVRSIGSKLLIGCVVRASVGTARWRIALLDTPAGLVGRHSHLAAV